MQVRRLETSKDSASSTCSMPAYIVGTPSKTVTLSRPITSSAFSASKRGIRVRQAPAVTAAFSPQVRPKQWNSGRQPITTSSEESSTSVSALVAALVGEVVVGELGALGLAGGARGVEQHDRVVVVAVGDLVVRLVLGQQLEEPVGLDGDAVDADGGGGLAGLVGHRLPREDDRGAGVLEVVLHLAGLQQRVHRDDDRAGAEHAVEQHRERRHVRQHQADPVAGTDALAPEQRGDPAGPVEQLVVAQHQVVEPHGRTVAVLAAAVVRFWARLVTVASGAAAGRCACGRLSRTAEVVRSTYPVWRRPHAGLRILDPVHRAPTVPE